MRPAGSPGTAGRGYRVAARGDPLSASPPSAEPATTYGCQTAPDSPAEGATEGRTALPAQRTGHRVTDGAFPSAATATATKETTLDETTVDVDATTEVAG